jgi:glycerol uptake facilitator-like aquaporin
LSGEFLVTTLFIFTVCATYINTLRSDHASSELMAVSALVTGFCSIALITAFGDVSGAHFNPAVTFGIVVGGKMSPIKGLYYIITQLSASLFAMLLLTIVYPPFANPEDPTGPQIPVVAHLVVQPAADAHKLRSLIMEIILSFILVYVIFATAVDTGGSPIGSAVQVPSTTTDQQVPGQQVFMIYPSAHAKASLAPVSIGLTLGFLCFIGGSVSGGAFNPARVFGPGLCAWNWDYMWLYWLGDFTGAALAGVVQQRLFATKQ